MTTADTVRQAFDGFVVAVASEVECRLREDLILETMRTSGCARAEAEAAVDVAAVLDPPPPNSYLRLNVYDSPAYSFGFTGWSNARRA